MMNYCFLLFVILRLYCRGVVSNTLDSPCVEHTIINQSQLDHFLDNITSQRREGRDPRCIQLSLTANTYQLNMTKFVHGVGLKEDDSLTVTGENRAVIINCVDDAPNISDGLQSRQLLHASMVVFDGLVFTGCILPIYVEEVNTVVIQNCVFQDNQFGAVNIYNSPNVMVKNCTFYNNTSDGSHSTRPFQATGGGLSISCINGIYDSVNVSISECNFTDNSAKLPDRLQSDINRIVFQSGRGGGVAIFVDTSALVNCVVNNSVFFRNSADEGGGGLFCYVEAQNFQTFVFENLLFVSNRATIAGALLVGTLYSRSDSEAMSSVTISNCIFTENTASIGAVSNVYFYNGLVNNSVTFRSCIFTNNSARIYAGAVDVASYNFFVDRSHYTPVTFIDCIFDSNLGADAAAINIAYYNARFDNVTFRNNIGTTVRVIAAKVYNGRVTFNGNSAAGKGIVSMGGALYLLSSSQVLLHNGTHVNFVNNTGRVGAAVVVEIDSPVIPPVFRNINGHSLCFIQYSDPSVPFESLNPNFTSINFMDNEAIVGHDVYFSVELCPWFPPPQGLPFIAYDSREKGVLQPLTPAQTMELYDESVRAYPGEIVRIQMIPKDQLNQTTLGIVTLEWSRNSAEINDDDAYFSFSPSARVLHPQSLSYNVSYTIGATDNVIYVNQTFLIMVELFQSPDQNSSFNLTVTPCPAGLVLRTVESLNKVKEYECKCNRGQDENIAECVPDEKRLILKEGLWATNINTGQSLNGMMEYYQCPPGYCQCSREDDGGNICNSVYYYDNDDLQCVCDRQGYLCGKCRGDKGVSVLLNKCVSCGYGSIALIFGLVVFDIIVITVILLSSVTIFSWLYPVLFYIQVTPYIAQYFPVTFSAVQPYLHYISSAASLYFPYDFCIYPGMTALVSYSLRYIPVLLFSTIYCIIWLLSRRYHNVSISWSGVWLLILLLFTGVVNTSVSILNCPILRDSDGHRSMRWFVDGTVKCFSEGHAGLATFAILVLIVCTLLIIALVVVVLGKVKTIKGCRRVHLWTFTLEKLLQEPFVDQYKWWASTELIKRLLLIILIMAFPGNLIPAMWMLMISVAIYMYIQPHQGLWTNILEVVLLGDILLMVMITSTDHFKTTAVFDSDHSFSIDQCGNVDQISDHAAVLIPFYCLPIIILLGFVAKEIFTKVKGKCHTKKKISLHHNIKSSQSTCIVGDPIGGAFEVSFDSTKDLTLRLVVPQEQDTNIMDN